MKKCPACNTDCVPLVGGDGQEHLGHVTGPDGNFPACPILSGEMAEAQERALDGSVIAAEELISDDVPALLLAIKRLTIERDSLRHHVDSLEHMSVRAMKELAQTRGELEQARQEREQIRQIGRQYEIAFAKDAKVDSEEMLAIVKLQAHRIHWLEEAADNAATHDEASKKQLGRIQKRRAAQLAHAQACHHDWKEDCDACQEHLSGILQAIDATIPD